MGKRESKVDKSKTYMDCPHCADEFGVGEDNQLLKMVRPWVWECRDCGRVYSLEWGLSDDVYFILLKEVDNG